MVAGEQQLALASVAEATTAFGLRGIEARHEVGAVDVVDEVVDGQLVPLVRLVAQHGNQVGVRVRRKHGLRRECEIRPPPHLGERGRCVLQHGHRRSPPA